MSHPFDNLHGLHAWYAQIGICLYYYYLVLHSRRRSTETQFPFSFSSSSLTALAHPFCNFLWSFNCHWGLTPLCISLSEEDFLLFFFLCFTSTLTPLVGMIITSTISARNYSTCFPHKHTHNLPPTINVYKLGTAHNGNIYIFDILSYPPPSLHSSFSLGIIQQQQPWLLLWDTLAAAMMMIIAIYHPPLICVYNSTTTDWVTTRITLPNELCTNAYLVVVAVAVSVVALWVAVKILWPPNLFALGPHWLTAHGTFIIIIILIGYVRQMIISWPGWTDDCLYTSRIYLLFAHHDDTHHVHCELKGHPLQLLLVLVVLVEEVQWPECSIIVSRIAHTETGGLYHNYYYR